MADQSLSVATREPGSLPKTDIIQFSIRQEDNKNFYSIKFTLIGLLRYKKWMPMSLQKVFHWMFLPAIILFNSTLPLYANQEVLFDMVFTEPPEKSDAKVQAVSSDHKKIQLIIGKDYFQVNENGLEYIYDFADRKVFVLNPKSKIYEVYSLYTYLGFRTAELENRLLIYDNFRKIDDKHFLSYLKPVYVEHDFSIKSTRDTDNIQIVAKPDKTIYMAEGGSEIMETSLTGKAISKNESEIFSKFMRYRAGGHPEILKKITDKSAIPEIFSIRFYGATRVKNDIYKLVSIKNTSDTNYSLEGYKRGPVNFTGEFINYLNESAEDVEKKSAQRIELINTEIKDSMERKSYFEAVLGCMEIGLYNSHFDVPVCKTNLDKLQADDRVKIFLNNLNTNEKESIKVSFQKLKELESIALKKSYVIWVFEANLKARLGESQEAFDLYYKALKMNPYLTGVYKDIGEIFYNNYNMDLAWLCWDTGRKIYREHSMLKEIDRLEENLVKKYPEFF